VSDYSAPADFLTTLRVCAEQNIPTMLMGPAGTGKTEAVQCVAALLNRPMVKVDCGAVRDAADWFGTPTSIGGRIGWQDSILASALQTEGCIILLDEINRSHSAAQNGLLGALDGTRRVSFPSRAEPVMVAENVMVFASANIGLAFSSTGALDLALLDRFTAVETDYLTPTAEAALIRERVAKFKKDDAETLAEIAAHTRTTNWGALGGRAISTRRLLTVARLWQSFTQRGASPALAVRTLVTAQPDDNYGGNGNNTPRRQLAAHIAKTHADLA
jgi:MoxR-like ATPase